MYAIEFQARVRNGIIEIPAEQWQKLAQQSGDDPVRVIVLAAERPPERSRPSAPTDLTRKATDAGYDSLIKYLLDNPLEAADPTPLPRETLYDRHSL